MPKRETLNLDVKVKGADDIADISDDIDGLFKKVDKLTARPAELLLTAKFGQIEGEIADLVLKLDKLDSTDPEVEITIARLNQLQGDLDAVIGKIREVDAAKAEATVTLDTSGVDSGIRKTASATDELSHSARGANSALANMIGNTSQDMGELLGITGSLGVGIGQMGEYAADATLDSEGLGASLISMAKVAGPIAALSLATLVLGKVIKAASQDNKELEENTREMSEAFEDSIGTLDDWKSAIDDAFSIGTANPAIAFSREIHDSMEKALDPDTFQAFNEALGTLGLTYENLNQLSQVSSAAMGDTAQAHLLAAGATANQVERLQELITETGSAQGAIDSLNEQLLLQDDISEELGTNLIDFIDKNRDVVNSIDDVSAAFDKAPLDKAAEQFLTLAQVVDPTTRDMVKMAEASARGADGAIDWSKALQEFIRLQIVANREAQVEAQRIERTGTELNDLMSQYEQAGDAAATYVDQASLVSGTQDELNQAMSEHGRVAGLVAGSWKTLIADIKDGNVDTSEAIDAWHLLQETLHLTDEEMQNLVDQKVQEALQEDAAAAEEFRQSLIDLSNAVTQAGVDVNTTDFRADAIGRVFDQLNEFSDLDTAEQLTNITDAWAAVDQAARDFPETIVGIDLVPDSWEDVKNMPDDLKGITDAIGQFRDTTQTQLAEAFEFGGPEGLRAAAADIRAQFEGPFREMMARNHASVTETNDAWNQFLHDVGLAPSDIEIVIGLEIDQQKLQILQDIASGAGLTGDRKLAFEIAIANQDPATALRILNEQLATVFGQQLTLSVDADTGQVTVAMDALPKELTATVTAEPVGFRKVAEGLDDTAKARTAPITAEAHTDKAAGALDTTASDKAKGKSGRTATITAVPVTSAAENALNTVARARSTLMSVLMHGALQAEAALNTIARDRTADIFVHTHGAGSAAASVSAVPGVNAAIAPTALGATPTAVAAPSAVTMVAPAPTAHNTFNVTLQAGVIGNRFETQRAVRKALRESTRLVGSRN